MTIVTKVQRIPVAMRAHIDVPGSNAAPFATVTVTGPTGATGATGPGVAAGGDTGAVLVKSAPGDYLTTWLATTAFGRGLLALVDAAGARTAIGLGSVDNTADTAKPVSTAQAAAIAAAVAAEATLRSSGDSSEATARAAGDAALDVRLDVLEADPTTAAAVAAAVAAEAVTRAAADTAINDTLATKTDGWVNGLIAAAVGSVTQAYSTTLTALAGLTTTAFGRSVLTWADAAALRTAVALPTSTVAGRLARYTNTAGAQGSTTGLFEDASGNVGIGTAEPNSHLTLANADPWADIRVFEGAISSGHEIGVGGRQIIHRYANGNYRLQLGDNAHNGGSGNDGIAFGYTGNSIAAHGVALGAVASKGLGLFTSNGTALTERMRIDAAGNVGIGTTIPGSKLHISSPDSTNTQLTIAHSGAASSLLRFLDGTTEKGQVTYHSSGYMLLSHREAGVSIANTDLVLKEGNVGIGTTAPFGKLHVYTGASTAPGANSLADEFVIEGSGNVGLSILTPDSTGVANLYFGHNNDNDAGRIVYNNSNDSFDFFNSGTQSVKITGTGNVGIGTTGPNAPLSFGSNVNALKLFLYENGNTRYGLGVASGELRTYAPSGSNVITWGAISTSDGTTFAEKMRLDLNTGNVGIGTTSPVVALDVNGPIRNRSAYTVATLPAASLGNGIEAYVTDSTLAANGNLGTTVTGGGANRVKVRSLASAWIIAGA